MDAKEQEGVASSGEQIVFDGPSATLIMTKEYWQEELKQARNDALEEAAKLINVPFNIGDESIEAKLTRGYVKSIRDLKEK